MVIGDPRRFAIESEVTCAYENPGFMALGFFVIHLDSMRYGVREPDATLLACSFDEVERRLSSRGRRRVSFSSEDAGTIADAVSAAIYSDSPATSTLAGLAPIALRKALTDSGAVWAPDGDEAFDDGSMVLQFDEGELVRLMGYRRGKDQRHDPASLKDVWIESDRYYGILEEWRSRFHEEWRLASKKPV